MKSFLFPKTVDTVMAKFTQGIADLEEIRERNISKAEALESTAESIEEMAKHARTEAARASRAMQNINSLLVGL